MLFAVPLALYGCAVACKVVAAFGDIDRVDRNGLTQLHIAARDGRDARVFSLIGQRADVDAQADWRSALWLAAHAGHVGAVRLLLDAGASQRADLDGVTPLAAALRANCEAVVRLLLAAGADVEACDAVGVPPLLCAIQNTNSAVVRLLITASTDLERRQFGLTMLLHAIMCGSPCVPLLLAAGAYYSVRGNGIGALRDCSSMKLAATCNNYNAALLLLAAGAECAPEDVAAVAAGDDKWLYIKTDLVGIARAREKIKRAGVVSVRDRAFAVCVGLQSLDLSALELAEIVEHACAPFVANLPFHLKWDLVVCVKHFHDRLRIE